MKMLRSTSLDELPELLNILKGDIKAKGVFRVDGMFCIPIRVIVTSRLDEDHAPLRILARGVGIEDVGRFVEMVQALSEKDDRENVEAVLEVSTKVNRETYRRVKEANAMGPALRELMSEELEQSREAGLTMGREEGRKEGLEDGIRAVVELCKGFGGSSMDAVESIVATMGFSQAEANRLVEKYW